MAHQPNPTDVVGTVDTTGINPGPHSNLEGVSPIFEIAKDTNEKSISEHFAEKALAAGTQEYQDDNPVGKEPHESEPFPAADETPDTSDTGGRAPQDTINRDLPPMTSTDQEGADNTSGTVSGAGGVDGSNDLSGEGAEAKDTGSGPLEKRKVTQLRNLAEAKGVEVPAGASKGEIAEALSKAGVGDDA